MSVELRPLGVACNLACHYCYQNPQRDAGNQRMSYDLEKMKAEAARIGRPFTLFGGEPLLMRFEDLENLLEWGLATFGGSSIQTNGVLIEKRHIDLFRRCKVSVGISLDGPGELNDARWHRGLERTRQSTAIVEDVIVRLCREHQPPGMIVTLHRGNATAEKLPLMADWMRHLHATGIKSVRLHLLEVDHEAVRDGLALSARENIQALLAFAEIRESVPGLHIDLFEEMERLLSGQDSGVGCVWRACDPYTTEAVQGIEGNGQSSNCGRTNKEGIGFIKANKAGYERHLALYRTPQTENGCAGCRFFLMCKGQCPGTSIDGDWRNRTEHCQEWMHLFSTIERRMILAGKVPLTIQPIRFEVERRQIEAWENGTNPSINQTLGEWNRERNGAAPRAAAVWPKPKARVSWVSEQAREIWQPRLERLPIAIEEITVHAARMSRKRCTVRLVPGTNFHRLLALAEEQGLGAAILPPEALPGAICTRPGEAITGVLLAGTPAAISEAQAAWAKQDLAAFHESLNVPSCCLTHSRVKVAGTEHLPQSVTAHSLLGPLGISVLPVEPCRHDCPATLAAAEQWLELASAQGYATEVGWLRECFSWAVSWSELHGVIEVKTPLFKMCVQMESASDARLILRAGISAVEGSAPGLSFPYVQPARQSRTIEIAGVVR